MSVQKIDNFDYRGKKPNFARDSVATLADLLGANANHYPDGHIVYCQETDLHYKFNSSNEMDEHTGRFRLLSDGEDGELSAFLNAENPPVAKPTISVDWIAHNSDGTELDSVPNEGGTASSPIVEKGYKMRYEATYSWKSAEGYQDPTSVDTANSDWKDESTPPGSGVSSESIVLDSPTVTSDKTLKITLQAKEVGLKTNSDGYLVPASGFVRSSASVGVTFRNRLYYGKTRDLEITSSTLSNLEYKKLRPKENLTLQNLSTVSGEYYVYAFPIRLSEIAANGFTVWDVKIQGPQGFNEYTVDIINAAGVKIKYYVYRTVQSGSLSNTTLSFTY